jgi:DNA-binding transcriptional LysR family regulator
MGVTDNRRVVVIFKQFMIFAAVAKHRNVTRASEELRISQPGVSQQLKLLEQNFGVKLFKRGGRGVDLTDAGRLFLDKITPIMSQVQDLNKTFSPRILAPKIQSLVVGGTYSTSTSLLPSLLALFKKRHPRVDLGLRTGDRRAVERLLLSSEIELAVMAGNPRSDRLIAEPYGRYRLVAIVTKNHPLAKKKKVSTRELAGMPLVIQGGLSQKSTAENLLTGGQIEGFRPNIAMRCDSPEAIKIAVREGIGIGILYEDAVKREIKKGKFKILKFSDLRLEGESSIVYRRDKALSTVAVDFLRLLRDWRKRDQRSVLTGALLKDKKVFYGGALFGHPHSDETPPA